MTKKKLDEYLNRNATVFLKNGETIYGRVRKIKNIYIIGKDIELLPSDVKRVKIKNCSNEMLVLEKTKVEPHLIKELCMTKATKNKYTRFTVRYANINGKVANIVKSFSTLEQAKDFKAVCDKNINEFKFAKRVDKDIFKEYEILEYPETLLKAIGILPKNFDNYYNEIVPNFEENFEILCKDTLLEREKLAIISYYKDKMTLEEIGKIFNRTRERVRQIIHNGIVKLSHSRARNILTSGNHQYELINAKEREELYEKIKREMTYELALDIVKQHEETKRELAMNFESIDELDLSVRSYNCLHRAGVKYVSDLTKLSEEQVMKIRNLGKKSFKEIRERLADRGLTFKEEDYENN